MFKIYNCLNTLETFILDTILPKKCLGCQKDGTFFCPDCLSLIKLNSWQTCPICEKSLTEYGKVCRYCQQKKLSLDALTTASSYSDPLISKLVHIYKYKFINELSAPLSQILIKAFEKNKLTIPDLIIPVPLHPLRLRWRGFNQAELLAQNLAQNLLSGLPIEIDLKTLTRIKYTSTQANLKKIQDRQQNIQEAFEVDLTQIDKIKNRRILLIDDICTTASTLLECGKQLRKLKPKSIQALVIARQG